MQALLNQIQASKEAGLYYVCLMAALTIPDVGGSAETPKKPNGVRYRRWFNANMPTDYFASLPDGTAYLDGDSAWRYRCSMLHEGSGKLTRATDTTSRRVLFLEPGGSAYMHRCAVQAGSQTAIILDLVTFVDDMCNAASVWLGAIDQPTQQNLGDRFVTRHPDGVLPFVARYPVFG